MLTLGMPWDFQFSVVRAMSVWVFLKVCTYMHGQTGEPRAQGDLVYGGP